MPGGLWASINHTVLSLLSLFVSFVLMLPQFPEGVRTLQLCDLERQAIGLLLEILTSKDLSESPSDRPSSRRERLHNNI